MKIETTRFGELNIADEEIVTFSKGIVGFPELQKYILLPVDVKKETPFFYLQSIEQQDLCFIVLETLSFFSEYDIELDESLVEELQIEKPEDILILSIVTSKGSLKEATTNLKAPIILNMVKKTAKQYVLEKGNYVIRQPLFISDQPSTIIESKG
ncbi:flagellar assembly protein FliW [Caldalkalibacillus mannanilyticus]|uniref:flagellar assembly protein FliW n=1 Tax=Caldalkalibacillus mannanilyticus TaxID=1418 RepID=UPI000468380E|nr:flagellar assembly protein FliW [Caldalkalibacillus mannanilyticus]